MRAARAAGMPCSGELELGWRLLPNESIAVTGSNGKTTTTELVGAMHRAAGVPVAVAGNVGTALSTLAGTLAPGAIVVCEASSFQLEDTLAFAPDAAVLLNLAPDHLDRHGTFAAYREAKLEIFAHQARGDGGAARRLADARARVSFATAAGRVLFGAHGRPSTAVDGAADLARRAGRRARREIRLRGAHNLENAMAAAARRARPRPPRRRGGRALRTFAGVEHRLEEVGRFGGVLYVDDSKATNVASAVVGIRSFAGGVHAILGGRGKERGLRAARRARRRALPRRLPRRRGGRSGSAPRSRPPRPAQRLRRSRARRRRRPARRPPRRRRPALARLRLLRPVRLVRRAGRRTSRRSPARF